MTTMLLPPAPGIVAVGNLSRAKRHKRRYDLVITLEDPKARSNDQLRFTHQPAPAHLVLPFEDVDVDTLGIQVATRAQVSQALEQAREFAEKAVLVHCFHGVGRSAAIALSILADRAGPGKEADTLASLLVQRPQATPNMIVLKHADTILGTSLVEAVTESERVRGIGPQRDQRLKFCLANPSLYAAAPDAQSTGNTPLRSASLAAAYNARLGQGF